MKRKLLFISYAFSRTLLALVLASLSLACAGPSTPFGSIGFFDSLSLNSAEPDEPIDSAEVQISMNPNTKTFLKPTDLKILISDPKGIGPKANYSVFYNGRNVTNNFKISESRKSNPREVFLTFKGLRLPPSKFSEVTVSYQRNPGDAKVFTKRLEPPTCNLIEPKTIKTTLSFDVESNLIQTIEETALDNKINPNLLAALTAQESGFNSKAISTYKAIGLTQMTNIAEKEIIEQAGNWPRYPGISDLSFWELKYKIVKEDIHEQNEWRMDPKLSLLGGSLYLNKLKTYWARADKQKLVKDSGSTLTQVILASYNIGPATVSRAIERKKKKWLTDHEGATSTKYVNLVGDYCQKFAAGGPQ